MKYIIQLIVSCIIASIAIKFESLYYGFIIIFAIGTLNGIILTKISDTKLTIELSEKEGDA
jgi:hypothetical protein